MCVYICCSAASHVRLFETPWTARLPCPSPSPGACSNLCPLSRWCYLAISSSVVPFSSCLQSFSAIGFFLINWLFTSDGQSIGASAQHQSLHWIFRLISLRIDWLISLQNWLISLQSKGLSRVFSNTAVQKAFGLLHGPTLTSIHDYWKNHKFDYVYI